MVPTAVRRRRPRPGRGRHGAPGSRRRDIGSDVYDEDEADPRQVPIPTADQDADAVREGE